MALEDEKELARERARERAKGYRPGEVKVIEAKKVVNIRDSNETLRFDVPSCFIYTSKPDFVFTTLFPYSFVVNVSSKYQPSIV